MPDAAWAVIGTVAVAVVAGFGALFKALMRAHATIVALNAERLAEAKENAKAFAASRYRLARNQGLESDPPPPDTEWDELSAVTLLEREQAERARLASVCRDYHPSRPPTRYRMKSRPDR